MGLLFCLLSLLHLQVLLLSDHAYLLISNFSELYPLLCHCNMTSNREGFQPSWPLVNLRSILFAALWHEQTDIGASLESLSNH